MSKNTGRGKVAYSWISSDPVKAGPTLGGGGGVVVVVVVVIRYFLSINKPLILPGSQGGTCIST